MPFASVLASALLLGSMGLVACASEPQLVSSPSDARTLNPIETDGNSINNKASQDVGGKSFVEIEFKEGSSVLTNNAKRSLRKLIAESGDLGKIDEVLVLSWADEEYPSGKMAKLPKDQVRLAARRGLAVQKYLKSIQPVGVRKFNLAEQASATSKWMKTTDAQLKSSLLTAGLPTTEDDLQYPSKASHSVIIVKVKK